MEPKTTLLFVLGGTVMLWALSRTKTGAALTSNATDEALGFIDVAGSRVNALLNSRGYRNKNPGNIRYIAKNPWNGQMANDAGYGVYDTAQNGTRALGRQLRAYAARGLVTVRDIIATWAPSNENNTTAYIKAVSGDLAVGPDERMNVEARLGELARAIAKHENGYIDSSYDFDAWARL